MATLKAIHNGPPRRLHPEPRARVRAFLALSKSAAAGRSVAAMSTAARQQRDQVKPYDVRTRCEQYGFT